MRCQDTFYRKDVSMNFTLVLPIDFATQIEGCILPSVTQHEASYWQNLCQDSYTLILHLHTISNNPPSILLNSSAHVLNHHKDALYFGQI